MSFGDVLRRRLGQFYGHVKFPRHRAEAPPVDPAELFYRRAAGIEVRVNPDASWSIAEAGRPPNPLAPLDQDRLALVGGLTTWKHASELALPPATLFDLVTRDLLFYARGPAPPSARLSGDAGALDLVADRPLRRRAGTWATPAIETATRIAPMPFMPKHADLIDAHLVGARFDSYERGHVVFGATIVGSRRTGEVVRHLLSALEPGARPSEILAAVDPALVDETKKTLALLDRLALLEPADEMTGPFAGPPAEPRVTWLGHAGVLLEVGGRRILVDPLFAPKSEPPERWASHPKVDARDLPPIDLVLITHGDNDHLHPNTLARLDRDTAFVIPATSEDPRPYQVDMRRMLGVLGFRRIREVDEWEEVPLGDVTVVACPFRGEDWDLELAQRTYLVRGPGLSTFFSADSFRMDEVYEALRARGPIDLAFMGIGGSAEAMAMPHDLGYGDFYREWIPPLRHNEWVQHCAGPADAAHSLDLLRPRYAFGYACGGASWLRTEYSDVGSHEELAALLLARPDGVRPIALPLGVPVLASALAGLPPVEDPRRRYG